MAGTLQVDSIVNSAGTGAPNFPNGFSGVPTNAFVAAYQVVTATSYTSGTPVNFDTKIYDPQNLITTGASWHFTAPFNCYVLVNGILQGSTSADSNVFINGTLNNFIGYLSTTNPSAYTGFVKLNSTQVFDLRLDSNETLGGNSFFYCQIIGTF